jgi:Ser/Thr protein kinase RdoA (MazF antagonist)
MSDDISAIRWIFEERMHTRACSIHQFESATNNCVFRIETKTRPYIFKVYAKSDWPENGKLPFISRTLDEHGIPHAELAVFTRDDERFPNGYSIEECLPGTTADRWRYPTMKLWGYLGAWSSGFAATSNQADRYGLYRQRCGAICEFCGIHV